MPTWSVARGRSAVGSASPCQGEGRGFESRRPLGGRQRRPTLVEWPRGEATACKAVYTGSNPVSTSARPWAISSAGERFPDTEEVTGSIPVSPTQVTGHVPSTDMACLVPVQHGSTAASPIEAVSELAQCLASLLVGDLGVDLHRDRELGVPED